MEKNILFSYSKFGIDYCSHPPLPMRSNVHANEVNAIDLISMNFLVRRRDIRSIEDGLRIKLPHVFNENEISTLLRLGIG